MTISNILRLLRQPSVSDRTGLKRASVFAHAASGLLTKPVKIGPRASGWPSHEIDAILGARIAGKSEPEIKALVIQLMAQRQSAA